MLDIKDLCVALGTRRVLHNISASIRRGEFIVLVGPNGCGKTTLLRAIAGLVAFEGRIHIEGRPVGGLAVRDRTASIAYLPQERIVHWPLTVEQVVRLGHWMDGNQTTSDKSVTQLVNDAMRDCELEAFRARPVQELSGGEAARALLARAIAMDANLLLADEPTASLDPAHKIEIMHVLAAYSRRGRGVIAATHDIDLALKFADRMIAIKDGKICADGDARAIASSTVLDDIFGAHFSRAQADGETLIAALRKC